MNMPLPAPTGDEDVCRIARDLIRFDTSNFGSGKAHGERAAAEYVAAQLSEAGLHGKFYEAEPGRTNVIARFVGNDPTLPALVLHGHLDVVPAKAADWSVDPFAGTIKDGMLWGRGAVDMKNMDAMILAAVRALVGEGFSPRRTIILAFFADEEANSDLGARWLVKHHPEVFAGADVAISEVGGFSVHVNDKPLFLIQTGEKGVAWVRMRCRGVAGHASQINPHNAVLALAQAVARVCTAPWPVKLTETTAQLVETLREMAGLPASTEAPAVVAHAGPGAAWIAPGLNNLASVTMFQAGYKENVVPGEASALIDVRVLPGERDAVLARIKALAGANIEVTVENEIGAVETSFDAPIVKAMCTSVQKFAPSARFAPYLLPAGTDNALLSALGIKGYGFVPLLLPPNFDFPAMFHGVDERIPLSSLIFGEAVLRDLIKTYCG